VGPTCQLGVKRGIGGWRRVRFPVMGVETGQGTGAARGPAGQISLGKNQKGFDF
jgi:hypothetical protein